MAVARNHGLRWLGKRVRQAFDWLPLKHPSALDIADTFGTEDCEEPPVTEPTPEPEPDAGTAEDSAVQSDAPTHQETSPGVGPEDPEDTDAKALDAPGVEEDAAPTSNKSSRRSEAARTDR